MNSLYAMLVEVIDCWNASKYTVVLEMSKRINRISIIVLFHAIPTVVVDFMSRNSDCNSYDTEIQTNKLLNNTKM